MVTGRAAWVVTVAMLGACGSNFETVAGSDAAGAAGRQSSKGTMTSGVAAGTSTSSVGATGATGATGAKEESGGGGIGGGGFPGGASTTAPSTYPGHGFVVHEWGTDTVVVGSDGSLQRGLHHEEEDLPDFVYDRLEAASALGAAPPSVTIKMETPVTYFYSDRPLTVQASVAFPQGVLTQWYPNASSFAPPVAAPNAVSANMPLVLADPVLDPNFTFVGDACRDHVSTLSGGALDWGTLSVLARESDVLPDLKDAPLDDFSWSYARAVGSNPVRAKNGETERFLFYRGLGNFTLPVTVTAKPGGELALANGFSEAVGSVFFINVAGERGAFTARTEGIAAGATLTDMAPSLEGAQPLAAYAEELGQAVTATLDATGLYHDEAQAMVNTWKRQWFRTPGTRLLYVIPQAWTDASIPLTIVPQPERLLRVMLIRVEVITPEQEAADVAVLRAETGTRAHFAALGRFAEPRLRRALALQYSKTGTELLEEIRSANSAVASGE